MLMIQAAPLDMLYICAELVTGKSIPVLVGITRLPIGQGLAWISVTMGAVTGSYFSVWAVHKTKTLSLVAFYNRLLQLCFSLWLSLSLMLSLAKGIHAERGTSLAAVPVLCIITQTLPQRHSTALVSFVLCCAVFYLCALVATIEEGQRATTQLPATTATMRRATAALLPAPTRAHPPQHEVSLTLHEIIARAFQLFVLGFYACVQHAPTQTYFDVSTNHTDHKDKADHHDTCKPVYASHHHAKHATYCCFICMLSAWIRVCVWSAVCFLQDNKLHTMLENNHSDPNHDAHWSWLCCTVYMTALLYSACWTATQLREQVLPRFCVIFDSEGARLKLLVSLLSLATLFRQREPYIMFWATNALTAVCFLTATLTLKGPHDSG